jgi:endoglucanase
MTDDFIFSAWGKTTWGSDADKASLEADIAAVRGNFTDVPLIIGEWAASPVATEAAARWKYFDFFIRTAAKYNTATILWDNGADFLNRATHQWRDTVALDILINAAAGKKNSLPDSTTDGSTTQSSSAYIYHKRNDTVNDVELPFLFNGNTLKSAKLTTTGKALVSGTDYSVSGEKITFKKAFLSTVITPSSQYGSLANVTLTFSAGAPLLVNILQWATPTIGATSSKIPATSADVKIPITWTGQDRPAAIKAVKSDGAYLVDDWTQYLPELQKGRITYNGQYNWDGQNVILTAAIVDQVRSGGKDTTFTIEFYPRVPGNAVNYTLTV